MQNKAIIKSWQSGNDLSVLNSIHLPDVNIAICERDISNLEHEIEAMLLQGITLKASGSISDILGTLEGEAKFKGDYLLKDIRMLLECLRDLTKLDSFRLFLATVQSDMCRRFHTDMNDLRLLCTYCGPGTLWLDEGNVNRKALTALAPNEEIVVDKSNIKQASAGDVLVLKGEVYPGMNAKAVVHRSPSIKSNSTKRLVLRIDTN